MSGMTSPRLLAHVGVRASNLERSLRFWRDGLGLTVADQVVGNCDLTDGFTNFRVFQYTGDARPGHVGGMQDYLHVGIIVGDLSAAAQRLQQLGFTIFWDGVDGGRPYDPAYPPTQSFKVDDPDGIVVDVSAREDQWPGVNVSGR
ncbi:MAG: VOC family protein [Actinobacteria bacterium]|jgi:catechol 2,3-dioxygenase-like lactoylglutathione lyase family enzyme|nr:VOC family protein [Actinomycetota bacterium]